MRDGLFVLFGAAAILWSLVILRWSVFSGGRRTRAVAVSSAVALVATVASLAWDVRVFAGLRAAARSPVAVRVMRRDDWWQVDYSRGALAFTTANELHLPAHSAVRVERDGVPGVWLTGACAVGDDGHSLLLTGGPGVCHAYVLALRPLLIKRIRIVVQDAPAFDAWLRNEALPAHPSPGNAALFASAGCAYCHRIRGAAESPWRQAPELTHFASRGAIAGEFPITRGFLSGWVVDSRGLKPSSAMPRNAVDPLVLHRLVTYLESLR